MFAETTSAFFQTIQIFGYSYVKVLCRKPTFLQLNIKSKGRYQFINMQEIVILMVGLIGEVKAVAGLLNCR